MTIQEQQLKFQADTIEKLKEKLKVQLEKKDKNLDIFRKKYSNIVQKDIAKIKQENLPTVFGKIFIEEKDKDKIIKLLSNHIKELKDFDDYERLKKTIEKNTIKDYLLEDVAKHISLKLIAILQNNELYKYPFYQELLKNIIDLYKDINSTINTLKLQQKQALAFYTLFLTPHQITWLLFSAIINLRVVKEIDEEDKNIPNTQQQAIKDIGELIEASIKKYIIKQYSINIQTIDNDHIFEMFSELFAILLKLEIFEEKELQNSAITYKFNDKFYKNSMSVYKNIIEYAKPTFEPMVVKPLPWTTIDDGGYLKGDDVSPRFNLYIQKTKTKNDVKLLEKKRETFPKQLLETVNIIQSTKWKINKDILNATYPYITEELEEANEKYKKIKKETKEQLKSLKKEIQKQHQKHHDIDKYYAGQLEVIKKFTKNIDEFKKYEESIKKEKKEEKKEVIKKISNLGKKKEALTKDIESKKSELEIKKLILDIAKKFQNFDEIYFTWQIDFRGRIYPVQTLLNPQGEDLAKALLKFSEKKPLGQNGLKWLKIHGANCYGKDKVSFYDRIKWVDTHKEKIISLAQKSNPFEDEFLQKADKKYAFLAFCYEYAKYLKNPDNFLSSIPIAMDGSNNGFQHISALLRDSDGAKKVNVLPNDEDIPADIYKEVAIELKKLVANNANIEQNKKELLEKVIDRNFVKKGVMTDSYGAGVDTKAEQIKTYMEDKIKQPLNDYKLIAKLLDKAIDKIAPSSAKYKKWINHIGKNISKQQKPIIWTTPFIGLEVTQVEYKTQIDKIAININGKQKNIQIRKELNEIDIKEQSKGIAPNFIHSLDATHMYLTILSCHKKGINNFSTVHDSFATHACNIDILVETLKEEFISLTNYDVLSYLQDEISKRYDLKIVNKLSNKKEDKVKQIENINNFYLDQEFDIEQIKDSTYFFS